MSKMAAMSVVLSATWPEPLESAGLSSWKIYVSTKVSHNFLNYLGNIEGDKAVRVELGEVGCQVIDWAQGSDVTDYGDVFAPVARLIVQFHSSWAQADIKAAQIVLNGTVYTVSIVPVIQFVVCWVGLWLSSDTWN